MGCQIEKLKSSPTYLRFHIEYDRQYTFLFFNFATPCWTLGSALGITYLLGTEIRDKYGSVARMVILNSPRVVISSAEGFEAILGQTTANEKGTDYG